MFPIIGGASNKKFEPTILATEVPENDIRIGQDGFYWQAVEGVWAKPVAQEILKAIYEKEHGISSKKISKEPPKSKTVEVAKEKVSISPIQKKKTHVDNSAKVLSEKVEEPKKENIISQDRYQEQKIVIELPKNPQVKKLIRVKKEKKQEKQVYSAVNTNDKNLINELIEKTENKKESEHKEDTFVEEKNKPIYTGLIKNELLDKPVKFDILSLRL